MNLFQIIIILFYLFEYSSEQINCLLTQNTPVNVNKNYYKIFYLYYLQPFPNLKKCYKHNEAACCNIINDGVISEYIESYIPEDCLRIFPELEDLLCFGCSQNERIYRNEEDKTIKICKNFAKKIWKVTSDEELDQPSQRFDGCGLLASENNFENITEENFGYIIPSKVFNNFNDFINTLQIPYYEDYEIQV